ncbi:hypothetical protein F5Y17DRAFT_379566 [Xylariaceae sp. FL0594]|nr:hypothetical protein F5Y17DRAFT_379566 [Xylariaceae sp. FL0594]
MKFAVAVTALAAGVSAAYPSYSAAPNVTYTTSVVSSYVTYCPGPTQITYGTNAYTVTEATTLTLTEGPYTVSVPVYTTSSVACVACSSSSSSSIPAPSSSAPAYPTSNYPVYPTGYPSANTSTPAVYPTSTPVVVVPTGGYPTATPSTTPIPTGGAGKVAALSGAAFAGLVGLVAFAL